MTLWLTPGQRSFGHRWVWGFVSAVISLSATNARAAEPTPTELAVAKHLFAEAVELERAERWDLAAMKLRDAVVIKDTPGLRFHLAHCEDKQGHLVEAMLHYDRSRELIAAGAKAPDVEAMLDATRDALEKRMPYLVLVTPVEIPQIKVEVNGVALAKSVLGRPAPVNPTLQHIVARATGYRDYVEDVRIAEGERRTVHINLQPLPDVAPVTPAAAHHTDSAPAASEGAGPARTAVLIAESAFTLAALGVGASFLLIRDSDGERVARAQRAVDEEAGGGGGGCGSAKNMAVVASCNELGDAISAYQRSTKWAIAGFVGAGVGAAATALTFALWPSAPVAPHIERAADHASIGVYGRF